MQREVLGCHGYKEEQISGLFTSKNGSKNLTLCVHALCSPVSRYDVWRHLVADRMPASKERKATSMREEAAREGAGAGLGVGGWG